MKKILIIDDDPGILKLLQVQLSRQDYDVITASDGVIGLEKIRDEKPDAILLDVFMPSLDGYSLVREMKLDAQLKRIPVIILTSKPDLQEIFRQEGIEHYFTKPFKTEEIIAVVQEVLKK